MADRRDRPWEDDRRARRDRGGKQGGGGSFDRSRRPGPQRGRDEGRGTREPGDWREPGERRGYSERREYGERDREARRERDWRPRPGPRGPAPRFERDRRPWSDKPRRPAVAPAADLLAEGEELVAGRRPVEEAFSARREARRLLVVPERRAALEALVMHAATLRIPLVEVEGGTLTSLTGFDGHQGVALAVAARPAAALDDVLARARERSEPPFVLVLDSLEDPQNLGTLLRSAEACGVHGVIFPTRRSAPLTPAAIKASAGATEHLLLLPVDDLPATIADLRSRGLRLVGADEGAPLRYGEADLRGPVALVVGSEERGISGALRRRLDLLVRIPMRGRVASLNAAVAGSVLLFAAAEQRGTPETGEQSAGGPDQVETEAQRAPRPRRSRAAKEASTAASEQLGSEAPAEAGHDVPGEPAPGSGDGEQG